MRTELYGPSEVNVFLERLDPGVYAPRRGPAEPKLAPEQVWPDEAAQVAVLEDLLPQPGPEGVRLEAVAMLHVDRAFAERVDPLIAAHWPEIFDGGSGKHPLYVRLKGLTAHFYLLGVVMTSLALEPKHLAEIRGLDDDAAAADVLDRVMPPLAIVQAAFLGLADDAVDHYTAGLSAPELKTQVPAYLCGDDTSALHGETGWRLLRAMVRVLTADLPVDIAYTPHVLGTVAILKEQLRALAGVPDRERLFHRTIGLAGTVMSFTIFVPYTPPMTQWGLGGGWMLQLLDDWMDVRKDWQADRITGFTSLAWDRSDIERQVRVLHEGIPTVVADPEAGAVIWDAIVAMWRRYIAWA